MIDQIFIAVTGIVSLFLVNSSNPNRSKYACFFGLVAQPVWFHTSWQNEQWGVVVLAVLYTWAWGNGLYNHWIKKPDEDDHRRPA